MDIFPSPRAAPSRRDLRIILGGLMLAMVLAALDQSIVNTALPRMASDLGNLAHLSWVVTAFMLSSTVANPIYGKLGDMYGRRRLLAASIIIFLASSALCGLAQTMGQLVLFRALQGCGAGGLMTLSQTVVSDVVTPRERGRYQGLFTGTFAFASVAGPLIGGGLTSALSWRWVFYVNLPLGLLALILILTGLRPVAMPKQHNIDYPGAAIMATAATTTLLLFNWGGSLFPWASLKAAALSAGSVLLWGCFAWRERRAAEPIMDLALFRIRSFAIGAGAMGMMGFAMMGAMVFVPLYFQLVLGFNPATAGLLLLPQIVAMLFSSIVGGHFASRMGRPKPFMAAGVALEAMGLSCLALMAFSRAPVPYFLAALATLGLGMGIAMPNATVIVQNAVPQSVMGAATGAMAFIRSLGGALGVAVSAGVMAAHLSLGLSSVDKSADARTFIDGGIAMIQSLPVALRARVIEAFQYAIAYSFLVSGAMMALAFLLSLTLRRTEIDETA